MIGFSRLTSAILFLAAATLDAEAAATLTLSKTAGPPTTALTVNLKGFAPGKLVDVYFDSTDTCVLITSATGAGTCSLTVPDAAQPRTHWITAAVRATGSGLQKSFLVRTDWPDHHGLDVSHDGFNRYENTISTKNVHLLDVAWSAPGTSSSGSAVVAGGKVYLGTFDGKLHAFDAVTGKKATGFPLSLGSSGFEGSPVVSGGVVYLPTYDGGTGNSTLHARNATTGASIGGSFPVALGTETRGAPIVVAGKLFIGGADGKLYGLNAKTGAALPGFPVSVGASAIRGTPAYGDGLIFFGDTGGILHGYDSSGASQFTGANISSFDMASPTVAHHIIYYASFSEHKLRAITMAGALPWSTPYLMASNWYGTPAVARGKIFVGDVSGTLSAVDAATGTAAWTRPLGGGIYGSATVANGVVFVATGASTYALDASDGTVLWNHGLGQSVNQSIAVVNGMVYVSVLNGNLTAFRIRGAAPDAAMAAMAAPAIADLKPDLTLKPR